MGQLTYRLVYYILQTLVVAGLSLLVAIPLVWGLEKKRPPVLRVFVTVLLASIAYMVVQWLNMSFIISWLMQSSLSLATLALVILPPFAFFVVCFIVAILLLDLSPARVGVAALVLALLSSLLYFASWGILPFISPLFQFLQTHPSP